MQRASQLVFHGGAWVFPGGRVDADDFSALGMTASPQLPMEATLDVSRRAAVREVHEESRLELEPGALVPLSHWTTPVGRPRRFATWFFGAALADAEREVVVDGGEIRAHRWLAAQEALRARDAGELVLPAPTFVTLTMLAGYGSSAELLGALAAAAPPVYLPRLHVRDDGEITVYQGDVAYEGGELERAGPRHRLNMLNSGWSYLRAPA